MKVLLDAGHGRNTLGKRSPDSSFYEYAWNREIASEIDDRLKLWGIDSELIVTEETDVALSERCRRVNNWCRKLGSSNVILISIHANASGNGKNWMNARGWSAYTTKGVTRADTLAEYLYSAAENILRGMKIRKDLSDGDRDWEENFYILKNTNCPAVLTENFFYDNKEDLEFILSKDGKQRIIELHVSAILGYLNSFK